MTAADRLFLEILFVAAILMGILSVNNIFLYKQKVRDLISMMLISGLATCVFEILWILLDGHPELKALSYLCVSLYSIVFVLFAALLNRYLLERLGISLDRKWEHHRLCGAGDAHRPAVLHNALDAAAVQGG